MNTLLAAESAEGIDYLRSLGLQLLPLGLRVLEALILLLVGRKLIRIILKLLDKTTEKLGLDIGLAKFLSTVIRAGLYVLLAFIIAGELGFNTASIVALLGSIALAIGLSLQGSLANFAGSVLILATRPFRVGDYIISSHGEGTVKDIGLVYTEIRTVDNKQITIPNGVLSGDAVTNVTGHPTRRLNIKVGISYGADLRKAKEIMENLYRESEWILQDQPVRVFVDQLEDSDVLLCVFGWVKTGDYLSAKWDLTEKIKLAFDEAGVEIPFPQMDVHMRQD